MSVGNINLAAQIAVRPRPQREYSYDDLYDRERRYGSGASLGSLHHNHHGGSTHSTHRSHRHRSSGGAGPRFAHSDIDLNLDSSFRSRRGSVYDERESEYAIIDVPAGTRRVTVDMARDSGMARESEVNWRRDNGVRRSRGLGNELWTEITKDLITREAIEDCGYQYEETDLFYYIFEYLSREHIAELIELTADIRRRKLATSNTKTPVFVFHRPKVTDTTMFAERVRDLEYESIAGRERERRTLDWDREDTRTEIIIERGGAHSHDGSSRRRRNRYYY